MIASKKSGNLSLAVNGKMFNTMLTDQATTFASNEIQEIEINSTIVPESYVC